MRTASVSPPFADDGCRCPRSRTGAPAEDAPRHACRFESFVNSLRLSWTGRARSWPRRHAGASAVRRSMRQARRGPSHDRATQPAERRTSVRSRTQTGRPIRILQCTTESGADRVTTTPSPQGGGKQVAASGSFAYGHGAYGGADAAFKSDKHNDTTHQRFVHPRARNSAAELWRPSAALASTA